LPINTIPPLPVTAVLYLTGIGAGPAPSEAASGDLTYTSFA